MDIETASEKYLFCVLSEGDRMKGTDYIFGFLQYGSPVLVKLAACLHGVQWSDKYYPVLRPIIMKKSEMPFNRKGLYEVILKEDILPSDQYVDYFSKTINNIKDNGSVENAVLDKSYNVALRIYT